MSEAKTQIDAAELAERLANAERITVLDVRPEADWPIEAPSARFLHIPFETVLADPASIASELEEPVAVVCQRGLKAQEVAAALRQNSVDARWLEGGMRGWIGALRACPIDLGLAGVEAFQVQRLGRGCLSYLIVSGGEALVVDPAPDARFYIELAAGAGARVTRVFDTHIHADHLSGARELAELTGATLHLPATSLGRGIAFAGQVKPLADGEEIPLGRTMVTDLALPGHTTDMTGLLLGGRAVIAGDSLFADGIARPDLQRSDPEGARAMARQLHSTIHERLLSLPAETILLPCHTHPGVPAAAIAPTLGEVRTRIPELATEDPERFAAELIAEMPPRPANYEAIIAVNSGTHPFDPELETGGNSCATR
jgi:glyoxylase-like metal-dependent hydrolase (beta-lactamase superfamily II)/rhodanese-related sulfurtransferase